MLEEIIATNDALRCRFQGGTVELSPSVKAMPAWFRGRALYRMSLQHKCINDDHSEGEFVFAGYVFYWQIRGNVLTLHMDDGL